MRLREEILLGRITVRQLNDLNATVFVFQFVLTHFAEFCLTKCYRNTDVDGAGDHSVFCFDDSVAECQVAVFICKFQANTRTVAGSSKMRIIEFYKIILESGFCKAFESYACSIDTSAGVLAWAGTPLA